MAINTGKCSFQLTAEDRKQRRRSSLSRVSIHGGGKQDNGASSLVPLSGNIHRLSNDVDHEADEHLPERLADEARGEAQHHNLLRITG